MNTQKLGFAVFVIIGTMGSAIADPVPFQVSVGKDVYQPADLGQVEMLGILSNRMDANRENRLLQHITEEQLLEGFRERPGSQAWIGEHVGKWLHAATLAYINHPENTLKKKIQRIAKGLMDCQMEDGYLGTYVKADRWSLKENADWDVWVHKYDLIGLLTYYRWFGDDRALQTCRRIADLLIDTFGDGKKDILSAGTHTGMAATSILEPMSLLYQLTGEKKYLDFCEYIIRRADAGPKLLTNIEKYKTVQSVGNKKAYEMMSNYVGLIEQWRATGNERYLNAVILAWESIANENLFLTGAVDAHEHFSQPHSLISTGPCTETCVQTTWIQMNWELLRATGNSRYAAMLHQHLYNHMLAAQHPDGINWCYFTTMEGKKEYGPDMHCCGSSGPRALAMIPTFAYMIGNGKIAINLYENSTYKGKVNNVEVTLTQTTDYPWKGDIQIELVTAKPVEFDLQLLIPGFVQTGMITVAGEKPNLSLEAGKYVTIHKTWSGKTPVAIQLDMPVVSHENQGRIALSRGPLVLAFEKISPNDNSPESVIPDVSALSKVQMEKISQGGTSNQEKWANESYLFSFKGKKVSADKPSSSSVIDLIYQPYCDAGIDGQMVSVWLPMLPSEKKQ